MTDRRAILIDALQATAAGDRDSLRIVYDMTSSKVFGTILRIVPRREVADDEFPEVADTTIVPADDWLCAEQDSAALANCLEELRDDHRRTIKLAFFEGLSHSELAERVNVPIGTLKSWIRRGLAGLKGCLGG